MKSVKYIMAAAAFLVLGTSCGNDWLNLEPSTSIPTDGLISGLNDMNRCLNGIYSTMQNAYAYSGRFIYYADATGDDMQAVKSTNRTGSYYLMKYTKDDAPTTFWSYPYMMLDICNLIIQSEDIETTETDLRDYYVGQAYAIRGMLMFELTRFYGYPYKKDNGASLGVPIANIVFDKDEKPARNTVAECYAFVISDLEKAISLMDNSEGRSFSKGRINRWATMALLSRVYLYHGDDQKAYQMATATIDGAEAAGYHLWSTAEYPTAWGVDAGSASVAGEVLFEVVNTTDDSPGKESLGYLHNPSGYYDICVPTSFYDLLMQDPDDVRIQLLKFKDKYGYFVYKYQPQEEETIYDANIPVLRLSEVYLNAAEAAVKLGDNTDAIKYLDAIVHRANPTNTVQGTTVTLDRVMTERRKELVGEGHRMYDALRDGGRIERYDVEDSPLPNRHLSMDAGAMSFDWNYYHCVLAIPKAEMDVNPNLVQNVGYAN